MTSKRVVTLAKLMADEKVDQILKAARDSQGLTTKQIAAAVKRPASQLYYTINKMVGAGLLEIVKQVKVKNLDEYYYTSAKLMQTPTDTPGLSVAASWTSAHLDEITQLVLYRNNQFLTSLQTHFADVEKMDEQQLKPASFADVQLQLSPAADRQLWQQITQLMEQAEKNDHGTDKQPVNLLFERWRGQQGV